jgi:hypothetical protein
MAADIFGRNTSNLAGVFVSDSAKLTLVNNLGVLVQRLQFTYSQTVTRLYEVGANGPNGSSNIYYVGGRTQGNLSIDRVIGPSATVATLYTQYGNVCCAKNNPLSLDLSQSDCSSTCSNNNPNGGGSSSGTAGNGIHYTMNSCVITQVSVGVQAQDMIISENTTMMFSSLSATPGSGG